MMEAKRPQSNVSPLKPPGTPDAVAAERRESPRHVSRQIKLTFMGAEHLALNWSESGVLLEDRHPETPVGSKVEGVITVAGYEGRFRFSAEIVRRDRRTQEMALRFVNPSRALLDAIRRLSE
ncbi:MAG TPA: PilZ domain-containing protein [Stellaceae bacterium]|nr:PilZ domain-containing protein [Stellaceae bacterium]